MFSLIPTPKVDFSINNQHLSCKKSISKLLLTLASGLCLLLSSTAIATPVAQFWIQDDPYTNYFMLLCSVSQGDNYGLAAYNIPLNPDPTSYSDIAPMGRVGLTPVNGFTIKNDWQGAIPTNDAFAGQDTTLPASLIRGIAQGIVDITDPGANEYVGHPNPPTKTGIQLSNNTWGIVDQPTGQHDYAIVLAYGNYNSTVPSIDINGLANVFEKASGTSAIVADVQILATTTVPPPNDQCQNAQLLSVPGIAIGWTTDATIDNVSFCGFDNTAPGIWYKVIGTGNTMTASTCTEFIDFDSIISVFSGTCQSLICQAASDDDCAAFLPTSSTASWCSVLGKEYLILVHGYQSEVGGFILNVWDNGVPCCEPPGLINCGDVVAGSNSGMVNKITTYNCVGWDESGPEMVYLFTTPQDSQVTVTLSDLTADLDLFILGSPCDASSCIAYGNDSVTFDALTGISYYIVVDGYSGAQSSFTLSVECQELPPCSRCGSGSHWIDTCLANQAQTAHHSAVLTIDTNLDCNPDTILKLNACSPPTPGSLGVIQQSSPLDDSIQFPGTRPIDGHFDVIDTQIVMCQTDGLNTITIGSGLGQGGVLPPSFGNMAEQPGDPTLVDSFFEVFFELKLASNQLVYNHTPLRISATATCFPNQSVYTYSAGCIPLYNNPTPGLGTVVANLISIQHMINPGGQPYCPTPLPGDINADCHVNLLDFAIMALDWLECNNLMDPECL